MDASIDRNNTVQKRPRIAMIIVAGGRSLRMKSEIPKPYITLGDAPILRHTMHRAITHEAIDWVQVVIHPEHQEFYQSASAGLDCLPPVLGGAERQDSVRAGLQALEKHAPDFVLIHDAARPLATHTLLTEIINALAQADAAMPVISVADTLRKQQGDSWQDVPRQGVMSIQTPQGFHFAKILAAHQASAGQNLTDDIAVLMAHDKAAHIAPVSGERANTKITTQEDIAMAEIFMQQHAQSEQMPPMYKVPRVAMGFDVHRLIAHKQGIAASEQVVWLGGIAIAHTHALEGHSDADVVLHALTDALLGTIAAGDIGMHFPPSDAKWKGANSAQFVAHAVQLVKEAGLRLIHIDITLMCEAPKLTPHRDAMRARIAQLLQIDVSQVSVKATTTEGLGFTGRKEGIAAHAVVTAG